MKKTLSVLIMATAMPAAAWAADYPTKNLDMLIPASPGGAADTLMRALQPGLESSLGRTIVVRNMGAGGGALALTRTVTAKPDGYTLTLANNQNFTLEGLGNVDFKYQDFDYLARVTEEPYLLVSNNNDQWQDAEGLVADLKESGKPLQVGTSGVGSSTYVVASMLGSQLGVTVQVVPFDGGSPAISALMGGHVDAVVVNPSEVLSQIRGDRLQAVLSTGSQRSEMLPDVKTMQEQGYDLAVSQWRGIAVPAGVSDEVEDAWVEAVKQAIEAPEFKRFAESTGVEVSPLFGEELDAYVTEMAEVMIPASRKVAEDNNQ
ncbi:tripartite tricarboxylate transporter substrate binding protein [Kushneria indalinina]|uniref:Tripartite-type tricarboxylate transporter receptor subunit TctC n=1 Tax=Kushneria indalinina DSM 14324 TaxID=1122140 RepID=A0A3D9E087_9GAMM|nr:tripartite tricarboxylate transporter substrate binding protein [Kushneria indalinina]REC96463.1 tripartite-type tricarboxylate transporter receptor subunit TctC [Kushneria indalinina DSM 14324]